MTGGLLAVSDPHIGYPENRRIVADLRPDTAADWLMVAGDVAERFEDVAWALRPLAARYTKVVRAPGNHERWTPPDDPVRLRGEERYRTPVELRRSIGVLTPEDPYAVWTGPGGPVTVAPLFLLYDDTFRPRGTATKAEALAAAYAAGVVCTDEMLLHPDPYPDRETRCRARIEESERRLGERDPKLPTVLINHFPLRRDPTHVPRHPEFALWCGTERTADWHLRHRAAAVVHGHLHIPRRTVADGVPFEEVSLGHPREWAPRGGPVGPRRILPRGRA
ncbi:metallophosphoesterase family protein [Kitasatospora sp. NPDC127111]|uniref:metallophosphoesterase family protein n=1 Tax=Kitasatospora sp. NPDC127111 TaxID=3345363 RepID=UPI0036440BF4